MLGDSEKVDLFERHGVKAAMGVKAIVQRSFNCGVLSLSGEPLLSPPLDTGNAVVCQAQRIQYYCTIMTMLWMKAIKSFTRAPIKLGSSALDD